MRSAYVDRRLQEIAREVPAPPPCVKCYPRRPKREPAPPPRPETIERIGSLYVRKVRAATDRSATWFDVAAAYAQGWKDAESVKAGTK